MRLDSRLLTLSPVSGTTGAAAAISSFSSSLGREEVEQLGAGEAAALRAPLEAGDTGGGGAKPVKGVNGAGGM